MVDGTHVAQRCLRCGATVDVADLEAAAEPAPDVVPARRLEPQPSQLPPAPIERPPEADGEVPADADERAAADPDDAAEPGEDSTQAALSALRELGELHAAGVLTDREFARKKAELLRRV